MSMSSAALQSGFPRPSELAGLWAIDPNVCFLNHGSFGGTPRAVMAAQMSYRARLEAEPVRFFVEELDGLLDHSRSALAAMVGAEEAGIVFVPNATFGVAHVLGNIDLRPGDEVVVNDQEYLACRNNVERHCDRAGARMVTVRLPFPIQNEDEAVAAIMGGVSPRTRLVLVSHTTSPGALRLPVERICRLLRDRGVRVLVDGAHGAGFVPLDVESIGCDYYTSNCHKWVCSPKGSAFVWVHPSLREGFRPLVLSNHAKRGKPGRSLYQVEFDYMGTADSTAYLAVRDAIEHLGSRVTGGWPEIMDRNRDLALKGREILCRALGTPPVAPESMIGPMAAVVLPTHSESLRAALSERPSRYHDALQDELLDRHRIQVPVHEVGGRRAVRISAQLHNSVAQYEYLARALQEELDRERRWHA